MEAEIIKLRQVVSQLRAQLPSVQLSSLDYDVPLCPQLSETETLNQQHSSSTNTRAGIDDQHKRKADNMIDDPASRAREFRREMNKRQTMPPPVLPQRTKQQCSDTTGGERYHEQRHDLNQEHHVDTHTEEYSNQFQQLGYSPQSYEDQPIFRGIPTGQFAYQGNQEHQFIDLTGSVGSSVSLSNPRTGSTQQKQQGNSGQPISGYGSNINIPFRSPLRTPAHRPINSLPVRGLGGEYFSPSNRPLLGTGTEYGNIPPSLQAGGNSFRPPVLRAEHLSPLTRQGGNPGYPYERGGQLQSSIPSKGGSSVASPFFTDPPTPPKNLGLSVTDGGTRRPASVAGFAGQQGGVSRAYTNGLGDGGFFSRRDNVARGVAVTTEVPHWNIPTPAAGAGGVGPFAGNTGAIRPGTMGGFSGSRGGDIFGPQRGDRGGIFGGGFNASGGGVIDRPGLRRSVRRD